MIELMPLLIYAGLLRTMRALGAATMATVNRCKSGGLSVCLGTARGNGIAELAAPLTSVRGGVFVHG